MNEPYNILDISQPVSKNNACFPGDTPFDYSLKASYSNNGSYNLTAFKMSPHIGTHADAPAHVLKTMEVENLIGNLSLAAFIGPCFVIEPALPIKFMELEAAPVRAVSISFKSSQAEALPC